MTLVEQAADMLRRLHLERQGVKQALPWPLLKNSEKIMWIERVEEALP